MAPRVVGNPGESAAIRGVRELGLILGLVVVLLVVPSVWAFVYYSRLFGALGILLAASGITVAVLWRRRDLLGIVDELRDSGMWIKGARGEFLVHQALSGLPDEFIVFHDYHPLGADGKRAKWNIDHIVVGPTGVFVLDAKNYSQQRVPAASANRHSRENVAQAQRNAVHLKRLLETWSRHALSQVFVVPVVVYTQEGARVDQLWEGPVRVLPLRLLVGDILRHTESEIDLERSGRVARALFGKIPPDRQLPFRSEMDAYLRMANADRRQRPRDAEATATSSKGTPDRCPRCGGKLERHVAHRGPRAGKAFLGCENYRTTDCTYKLNLD